jgi:hypothetical protein
MLSLTLQSKGAPSGREGEDEIEKASKNSTNKNVLLALSKKEAQKQLNDEDFKFWKKSQISKDLNNKKKSKNYEEMEDY